MTAENTEYFDKIYSGDVGSLVIDCCCGRTNFAGEQGGGDWELGEWSRLNDRSQKEPDKCIKHEGCDGVSSLHIAGNAVVIGCKCTQLRRYEAMIWGDRERILRYFALRQRTEVDTLNRLGVLIDDAQPKVKRITTEVDRLHGLLRERHTFCDSPIPGRAYPEYACGKCWSCRARALLTPVK